VRSGGLPQEWSKLKGVRITTLLISVISFLPDGEEVCELLSLAVEELPVLHGRVDQLKDERPASNDAAASRKKIPEKKSIN
jgi:hypothetical protein